MKFFLTTGCLFLIAMAVGGELMAQGVSSNGLKQMPRRSAGSSLEKPAQAKPETDRKDEPAASTPAPAQTAIRTRYDSMVYRKDGVIEFKGNVVIKRGAQELRADYVIYNRNTEEADAYGNVVMKRGDEVWRGSRLHYNFKLGTGDSDSMSYNASPFTLKAAKIERMEGNRFRAKSARVTTCDHGLDHPHFKVRAREIVLEPDESIRGKNTVFFLGPIPVFYLPYWYRDLDESSGWRFRPGYRSNWGAYLLSSYRYSMGETLRGETHLDYRTDRGFAFGQDFGWNSDRSRGLVELYYVNDDMPLDEDDDPDKDIDSTRYRVRLKNTSSLSDRKMLYLQGEYVSDVDMREDFFESEYQKSVQPENYAVYQHRGNRYIGTILGQVRMNDFYEGVNRIPEVSLDILRQPLAETLLYYESQTDISNLERVHAEPDSDQDYSSLRIDTAHLVNYPAKYMGYLTLIPRIGARATYYSATRETTETNTVTGLSDGPAELRTRFEIGGEASFKAYRTWGGAVAPRRHVVEPYADYTFVPEPNILPKNLYQFDAVDTLDELHQIKLGVRNKYQKKIDNMPFDLIDLNLYTFLVLDPKGDEESLQNFYFDGRLQPGRRSLVTFDGFYDTASSELSRFNARLEYGRTRWWQIGAEYHYVVNESSQVSADVTFLPDRDWTWNMYGRYEGEAGRTEEAGGYLQRNLDCMSIRTRVSVLPGYENSDGSEIDDEWRVMLEFWLTAFPEMKLSAKHGG